MRIALVHMRHAHTGGTERYLNLLSAHLAEAGHEPVIICRSHAQPHHAGVSFEVLRPLALGAAARMRSFARAVEAHLRERSFDLVLGLGKTWSHDVLRMGGGCQATYLELAHDATLTPLERFMGKGRRKHALALEIEARALAPHPARLGGGRPLVITNSELVRRDVIERHGLDEGRVRVIHNGVDTERFHPDQRAEGGAQLRSSLGWGGDEEVLLFLGTGYGRKGLDLVLEATALLKSERPALRLLVVGHDSGRAAWEARAEHMGLAGRCRFLGGRRDAERCYGAADVYALPTRYDPFANSTLEALASGLPTITTATNGGAEVLPDGVAGSVLSESPTGEELAAAIARWLERRAQGALAAREAAEACDARSMMARTEGLLGEVAAARG